MAFNSRAFHLLVVAGLMLAAVFTYAAAREAMWATFVLGICACGVLLTVAATRPDRAPVDANEGLPASAEVPSLRVLLDQVPVPLVTRADDHPAKALNRAARALFETDDIIAGDSGLAAAMAGPFSGGRPILDIGGRRYALSVSEVLSEDSCVRLATLTDVQMEIHKAEAAALRDTLHILSHEIMNSLTPVASLADIAGGYLADETSEAAGSAREALEMLSRRTLNLTRFIEAYRSVARLPEPELHPVDPARLIRDILSLFAHNPAAQAVDFTLDLAHDLPRVSLDEAQIGQAIINVLTNAVEATETCPVRRVVVSMELSGQDLVVAISDTGEGVPDSIRGNLFTAFATTKPKGTGAGLNLARQIALAHGGNLQLLEGSPTTFAFRFPVQG